MGGSGYAVLPKGNVAGNLNSCIEMLIDKAVQYHLMIVPDSIIRICIEGSPPGPPLKMRKGFSGRELDICENSLI